jgi:hypothetical protein
MSELWQEVRRVSSIPGYRTGLIYRSRWEQYLLFLQGCSGTDAALRQLQRKGYCWRKGYPS